MDSAKGAEAMIEVRNILVQRNKRVVLDIASLDIKRGETLAIVGPNTASRKRTSSVALPAPKIMAARPE